MLKPGDYTPVELPIWDYHADKTAWCRTVLWCLRQDDPWQVKKVHIDQTPDEFSRGNDTLLEGAALHAMFDGSYSERFKAVKIRNEKTRKANPDVELITHTIEARAKLAYQALSSDPEVRNRLAEADVQIEHTRVWEDEGTGLMLKCRPDVVAPGRFALDWKGAASVRRGDFAKAIANCGYNMQAAMFAEAYGIDRIYWAVVEKKYPFRVRVYRCGDATLAYGRRALREACEELQMCLSLNSWDQAPVEELIDQPDWTFAQEEHGQGDLR